MTEEVVGTVSSSLSFRTLSRMNMRELVRNLSKLLCVPYIKTRYGPESHAYRKKQNNRNYVARKYVMYYWWNWRAAPASSVL